MISSWLRQGILPVVNPASVDQALQIAQGLQQGGITQIEITLRTPAALEALAEVAKAFPDMAVSAGSVLTPEQFEQAANAGATLFISPGLTEALAKHALQNQLPWIPGVATASEVMRAMELGFKTLKFFPAMAAGGPPALQGLLAALQGLSVIPTGGISIDTCPAWKSVKGVIAVGGSWLSSNLPPENVTEVVQTRASQSIQVWAGLD